MSNTNSIDKRTIDKKKASGEFIPLADQLLAAHNLRIQDLPFIAVNQGPGPFTTLRVVIASVNGLSFGTHIPLIGVDALKAMHTEWQDHNYPVTIILFNAFSRDVYVAIEQPGKSLYTGCNTIDGCLQEIATIMQKNSARVRFIGNGATLYRDKIMQVLGDRAYIPDPNPDYCSIETIGTVALKQWQQNMTGTQQLMPLYLKKHPAQQQNQ